MAPGRRDRRESREWTVSAGRRRRRLPTADLRERILNTAVKLLIDTGGLTASLAHLNMEELIRIADVPRSSVYRAWGTTEAFYIDLMERMVAPARREDYVAEIEHRVARVLHGHADLLGTAEGRRGVLLEVVRCAVGETFGSEARHQAWRSVTVLAATLPALQGADRVRIQTALVRSEQQIIDRSAHLYEVTMSALGMRMKDDFDLNVLAATTSSVVDGLIRRSVTNPAVVGAPIVQPGLGGKPVEWSLPAVAVMAVIDAMTEPDPSFAPAVNG